MYHHYFGLQEPAFSIAVNPRYLYMSAQHKEALAHLLYGVQGGGFVLLSGEVGTGKTTIIRCLLEQLPTDTEVAIVLNPMASVPEMLLTICEELHLFLDDDSDIKSMMDALQDHLLNNHAQGKRTVLLIDEAQLLSVDVLEQIRLLTNLETSTEKLLQIILVGQPEVNELLAQPRLRQLSQRITARFHLESLNLAETRLYIEHRLKIAGKQDARPLFPDRIIRKIHKSSGGIPRLINILCERMLVGAYGQNKYQVDSALFQLAELEVKGRFPQAQAASASPFSNRTVLIALVSAAVLLCVALVVLMASPRQDPEPQLASTPAITVQPTATSTHTVSTVSGPVDRQTTGYLTDRNSAFARLFQYYGVESSELQHPCWQTERSGLQCAQAENQTWSSLRELNRPVLLSLITPSRNQAYVTLIAMNEDTVWLLDASGQATARARDDVGQLWNGRVDYLWRKPEGYEKPLAQGTRSPVVARVAQQFALLDAQPRPITDTLFSQSLKTRVMLFQTANGLEADGILGERTLMKLNETLGLVPVLLDHWPDQH